MSNVEDVEAAEARMNTAQNALLSYVEAGTVIDRDEYRRLAARVKKARSEFMKASSELGE